MFILRISTVTAVLGLIGTLPALAQRERPGRSTESSPSTPTPSSSGSYGSGAPSSYGSSSSSSNSSSSSYSSASSSSSYGSGSSTSYNSGSSYDSGSSRSYSQSDSEPSRPSRSPSPPPYRDTIYARPPRTTDTAPSPIATESFSLHRPERSRPERSVDTPVVTAPTSSSHPTSAPGERIRTPRDNSPRVTSSTPTRSIRDQARISNQERIQTGRTKTVQFQTQRTASDAVESAQTRYRSKQRPDAIRRFQEHRLRMRGRPAWWNQWSEYEFFVDYDWAASEEFFEVQEVFWNPIFLYYFTDDWSENLSDTWNDRQSFAFYSRDFKYQGVLLPTQAAADLLMNISTTSSSTQHGFLKALESTFELIQKELTQVFGHGYQLKANEVTIDGYQVLEDVAAVIEGTAGTDANYFPYKAILDLRKTAGTRVFIALGGPSDQSPETLARIQELNHVISRTFQIVVDESGSTSTIPPSSPGWYGIPWTQDYCVPKDHTNPDGPKISNPLNERKIGSRTGVMIANMICRIADDLIRRQRKLEYASLQDLLSYPNPKIADALGQEIPEQWQHSADIISAYVLAFRIADTGCRELEFDYLKFKYKCKKRLVSKREAAKFGSYLKANGLLDNLKDDSESGDPEVLRRSHAESYLGWLKGKAVTPEFHEVQKELKAITQLVSMSQQWTRQFSKMCTLSKYGPGTLRKKLAYNTWLSPLLFLLAEESQARDLHPADQSSRFLNGVRELGEGFVFNECDSN